MCRVSVSQLSIFPPSPVVASSFHLFPRFVTATNEFNRAIISYDTLLIRLETEAISPHYRLPGCPQRFHLIVNCKQLKPRYLIVNQKLITRH